MEKQWFTAPFLWKDWFTPSFSFLMQSTNPKDRYLPCFWIHLGIFWGFWLLGIEKQKNVWNLYVFLQFHSMLFQKELKKNLRIRTQTILATKYLYFVILLEYQMNPTFQKARAVSHWDLGLLELPEAGKEATNICTDVVWRQFVEDLSKEVQLDVEYQDKSDHKNALESWGVDGCLP